MYYVNAIIVGFAIPLLAYAIVSTWDSYVSSRARNLSAQLRSFADDQLAAIAASKDSDSNDLVRSFATHLRGVVNDSNEMRDRGEQFVASQNESEESDMGEAAKDFRDKVGPVYVDRFERIFPVMTTACLLLHPQLGRMYYRTIMRTASASTAAKRVMRHGDSANASIAVEKREVVSAPPSVLLFQSSRRREERQWEECAT